MKAVQARESDLLLVARRWAKRGRHTSVERFLDFFPGARTVTSDDALTRPYRLFKAIARRAGQDGYTSHNAGIEAAVLLRLLRRRPAIVHFLYADHDYHYAGRIGRRFGCRMVGSFFFSVEELERRMPDKSHLRHLDLVLASGEAQRRDLERFVEPERLAFLPLGVDTDFFTPPADGEERRDGPPRILQVGINRRDWETLAAVHRALRDEVPGLELHMVGCQDEAPRFAGEPGVVFHGFLEDERLLALYREAALLVLPLLEGGSSNALNEALAAGLPVVATRQPNLEDYVDPVAVTLTPPGDAAAMAAACRPLISGGGPRRRAAAAARRLAERFAWPRVKERLLALYRERLGVEVTP